MYVITKDDELIGHYGLRFAKDNIVMLDNAVRFSPAGGRDLFPAIQSRLLGYLRNFWPDSLPSIIVKRENPFSMALHNKFMPIEFADHFYQDFCLDKEVIFFGYVSK